MIIREAAALTQKRLRAEQTLAESYRLLKEGNPEAVPVFEGEQIIGVFGRKELLQFGPEAFPWHQPVKELVSNSYVLLPDNCPMDEVWALEADYIILQDSKGLYCGILDCVQWKRAAAGHYYEKAKQLEGILDYTHNGVIAIDQKGHVIYYNSAAEQIIRRKKEDVLGKHLSQVIIPLGLLDVLKTGKPQLCHKFTVEYSQGTRVYLTHRTPIFAKGELVGAVGVFQDVSEMESISQELQTVKCLYEELETLVECSFDGILICNAAGTILRANSASERFLLREPGGLQGKRLAELFPEEETVKTLTAQVVNGSSAKNCVVTVGQRQLLLTANPVSSGHGRIDKIIVNARDLTELNSLRLQLENTKHLTERYHSELNELRSRLLQQEGVVIQSKKMQSIVSLALRVAQVDSTVLITGESGVGKEIITKIIHKNSKRKEGPFIKINCGAIPESLLESELFGYEGGAFTGASKEGKLGLFELAHQGTLFLDEIGELPLPLQVKILRAIQEREINRVGGSKPRQIDVRIVTATNRNLADMVEKGQFREDLFFRLNVIPIHVPPLRERQEEIIPLAQQFKDKFCKAYDLRKVFAPEVMEALLDYHWPGNIRELENVIERLVVTTPGEMISFRDLPRFFFKEQSASKATVSVRGLIPLKEAVMTVEKLLLEKAMDRYGSTYKAAEVLQVDQSTIVRKLQRIKKVSSD